MLLQSVEIREIDGEEQGRFPWTVPTIAQLPRVEFSAPVCFFVGENGSGKSTLLEGMAAAAGLPVVGASSIDKDTTLKAQRRFGRHLRLAWNGYQRRGFFLRAEDFFGFAKSIMQAREEAQAEIAEIEEDYKKADRSELARGLATGPHRSSVAEMERRYGADLDANSHGQSFLQLFRSRLFPMGLFLLDEPESPLSPHSQLALLAMMHEAVAERAQFIIATHSPILLAYPGAQIVSFDEVPIGNVAYDDLSHVNLMRDFLRDPQRYLRLVLSSDGGE